MKRQSNRAPEGQVYALAVTRLIGAVRVFQLLQGPATRSYSRGELEGRIARFPAASGVCVILVEEPPPVAMIEERAP